MNRIYKYFFDKKKANISLFPREVKDCNKFCKILIQCGVSQDLLKDYDWQIIELNFGKYHCIGNHPIARRIDIIKSEVFV